MATLLTDQGDFAVSPVDGLWLDPPEIAAATGFVLKPEGMCRDELCVPLAASLVRNGRVDLQGFWHGLGNPVLHDEAGEAWVLGVSATERESALAGLDAPDFTLPDLTGAPHTLSSLRGRKVFLTTWASW